MLRVVGRLGGQQTGVDLPHRDRQRLLLRRGLDQGADVLQQTLAELAVVGVDLAGALGREDHQRVLRRGLVEQLVDRRVGDAFGIRDGSHVSDSLMLWFQRSRAGVKNDEPSNPTSSSAARSTKSLTTVTSNSLSAASSSSAWARRRLIVSSSSVPRPTRRRLSSSTLGGARNTSCASAIAARTWRAPCRSILSRTGRP